MLGGYVGQFLPLTGGSNFPMTGTLNMGGQVLANCQQITDNQSPSKARINTGGSAGTSNTQICDKTGTVQIAVLTSGTNVSNPFGANDGLSVTHGATIDTLTVSGAANLSGTVTLGGLVVSNNATVDGNLTVDYSISFDGSISSDNWNGYTTIFVDALNGNDSQGNGQAISPYLTLAQAISVATSGNLIFLAPGTYQGPLNLPAGVNVQGSGRGVTTIQNYAQSGGGGALQLNGSNCLIRDLTLDTNDPTSTHYGATVFLASGVTTTPTGIVFENVSFSGNFDGINPGAYGGAGGGTGPFIWTFRNCEIHGACWMYYDQCGITANFYDCDWIMNNTPARPTAAGHAGYAAFVTGHNNSIVNVYGGSVSIVDTSTNSDLLANAGVIKEGYTGVSVNVTGLAINISCPDAVSGANVSPFASWENGGPVGTFNIGPGTSFQNQNQFGNGGSIAFRAPVLQTLPGPTPAVASANLTSQTAAVSSVLSYTPSLAGTFRVSGYVTISSATTDVLNFKAIYTDETSTTRTMTFNGQNSAGTMAVAMGPTTGAYLIAPMPIRSAAGSAIAIETMLETGGGSVSYDVGAAIEQVSP